MIDTPRLTTLAGFAYDTVRLARGSLIAVNDLNVIKGSAKEPDGRNTPRCVEKLDK